MALGAGGKNIGVVSRVAAFSAGGFDFFRFDIEAGFFGTGSFGDDTEGKFQGMGGNAAESAGFYFDDFDGFKLVAFLFINDDADKFLGDA